MLSYNYCHWSQHRHIRSTWHFSELGPQADTDKNCKCCKCMLVAKGSLKPDIFHKNNYCLVCVWSCSTGHCICGTISWYFWLTWKGINTRVRNTSRNVLPSRCSQEISYVFGFCLKVSTQSPKRQTCWKLSIHLPVGLECMVDNFTSSLQTGAISPSFGLFKNVFIHFFNVLKTVRK